MDLKISYNGKSGMTEVLWNGIVIYECYGVTNAQYFIDSIQGGN